MMERRKFIKVTTAVSLASAIAGKAFSSILGENELAINQQLVLKGFKDEQEEYPSLVTDGKGNMWIYSLNRKHYPENAEVISAFHFNGKEWKETEPVTRSSGQYEAPIASCAPGGTPIVAWTEKKEKDWLINAALKNKNGFSKPYTFPVKSGRSINPVVLAVDKNRNWIAWENLYKSKLTIYISKYENGKWSSPVIIDKGKNNCFEPAIAEAKNGDLYVAYGLTHGFHQNIEMSVIDGKSLEIKKTVPIAVGGGFKDRVNLNTKPALAFDTLDRLWISYENNRSAQFLNFSDNYTGDRCCAILTYKDGKLLESKETGKWLFTDKNDHKPTFVKDNNGHLYLATHCGGDFEKNPHWRYRLSWLDSQKGWVEPVTILQSSQKSVLIPPAIAFDKKNDLWLSTCIEKRFDNANPEKPDDLVSCSLTQLSVQQFSSPKLSDKYTSISFKETKVHEYLPDEKEISQFSGHPKVTGEQITLDGEVYTLVYGNLHEHSENSPCWPAGTDGTLHDDYRFGMFTEGYDFTAITDHGGFMTEVYWRKNLRLADFYNEPGCFVAIPAMEWTKASNKELNDVEYGAGHYNVIFDTTEDAQKFIRNKRGIYSAGTPETKNSPLLWELLHKKKINCITIPHHPADSVYPVDWDVYDDKYVPVVELFQCRGNNEYPGCPREFNLEGLGIRTTKYKRAYVDYALKQKKYKMGFIASGDHNSMGVGVAALWVKELSRDGILEAMRSKRCFATTGDKMIVDFRVNGKTTGSTLKTNQAPGLNIKVKGQQELAKVEVLRNSTVIKEFKLSEGTIEFDKQFADENYRDESDVLYYYIRATQKNNAFAWSSPVWIDINS